MHRKQTLSCGARPSNKLIFGARGAVSVPVFVLVKASKNKFISMYEPNSYLNHFQQLLFHTIPRLLINEGGKAYLRVLGQNQYNLFKKRAQKLGYFDWRALQLIARVNHGTPASGVIGHMSTAIK